MSRAGGEGQGFGGRPSPRKGATAGERRELDPMWTIPPMAEAFRVKSVEETLRARRGGGVKPEPHKQEHP